MLELLGVVTIIAMLLAYAVRVGAVAIALVWFLSWIGETCGVLFHRAPALGALRRLGVLKLPLISVFVVTAIVAWFVALMDIDVGVQRLAVATAGWLLFVLLTVAFFSGFGKGNARRSRHDQLKSSGFDENQISLLDRVIEGKRVTLSDDERKVVDAEKHALASAPLNA